MKLRVALVVLITACLGLAVALLSTRHRAQEDNIEATDSILYHSNQWQETSIALEQTKQEKVNLGEELNTLSNQYQNLETSYNSTTSQLASTETTLSKTELALRAAEAEITRRDSQITELENQNEALDQHAAGLSSAITNLTIQIEDTQAKLTTAEGDRAFLEAELQRLMAEKAELERQLNDLDVLKAQISHLKKELAISRRLEWIRKGILGFDQTKGATKLMKGVSPETPPPSTYDLNVEVTEDGAVRVIPPMTDSPAETNVTEP